MCSGPVVDRRLLCLTRRIILATKRSAIDCKKGGGEEMRLSRTERKPIGHRSRPVPGGITRVRGVKVFKSFETLNRLPGRVNC